MDSLVRIFENLFDKKNLDLVIVAILALAVVMYDVTLDIINELLHLILELMHVSFEYVEMGIEHVVEHFFHTERYGSQIITFYILCSIGALILRQLWKVVPTIYAAIKHWAIAAWIQRSTQLTLYWQLLSLSRKITLALVITLVMFLASFFVM